MKIILLLVLLAESLFGQAFEATRYIQSNYLAVFFSTNQVSGSSCGLINEYVSPNASTFEDTIPSVSLTYSSGSGRDFSIMKFSGTYWLAFTTCGYTDTHHVGIASSVDGITWGSAFYVETFASDVNHQNAWAPEWFIDPNDSGLSSVHLAISLGNIGANLQTFSLWAMHPTASNFSTWSTPVQIDSVQGIDPAIRYIDGSYRIFYRSVSSFPSPSCIQYDSSSTVEGTYTYDGVHGHGDWAGWGCNAQEGPSFVDFGSNSWRIFMDLSGGDPYNGQVSYSDSTNGLTGPWSTLRSISTTHQAKQGTVIPYP